MLIRAMRSDEAAARRAIARAKRLRESLHAWFARTETAALTTITEAHLGALRHRELRAADDRVTWTERAISVRSPVDRLAVEAVGLMIAIPPSRVKECGDSACGWLFLDSSRRQNRRWCSAADCGNRDRARRHYARLRTR